MRHAHIFCIVLMLATAITAYAQEGLTIGQLFDGRFRSDQHVMETHITGGQLNKHHLDIYRSLSLFRPDASTAENLEKTVRQDGAHARSREIQYKNGKLYYGFYQLPRHGGNNRYLFYLNQLASGGDKIIIIYMEGTATREQVKKMLRQ